MSATDDGGNARRGLSGWLDRLRGPLAAGGDAVTDSAQGEGAAEGALLDAVVSGLPDPVVALEEDGRVISFNAGAAALAPALRRGDLASIALRMPELNEAIRTARATGKAQRGIGICGSGGREADPPAGPVCGLPGVPDRCRQA